MPPSPSDAAPRPPGDFAPVLAAEKPLLLVGGQAVNLWALYYRERTAELAPFVSHDADVLGDRETLAMLGKLAGVKPQFFPLRPPSNEVGVVVAKDTAGQPMLIEVLRNVHGVDDKELREPIYTLAIGEGQVRVQVPGPIALLQAKIANVADLKQTGRQDARHVRILAQLMPGYLADLIRVAVEGRLPERKLLELAERLLAVVITQKARKIFGKLQLNPRELFVRPDAAGLPKLRAFLEKRLPRALSA